MPRLAPTPVAHSSRGAQSDRLDMLDKMKNCLVDAKSRDRANMQYIGIVAPMIPVYVTLADQRGWNPTRMALLKALFALLLAGAVVAAISVALWA